MLPKENPTTAMTPTPPSPTPTSLSSKTGSTTSPQHRVHMPTGKTIKRLAKKAKRGIREWMGLAHVTTTQVHVVPQLGSFAVTVHTPPSSPTKPQFVVFETGTNDALTSEEDEKQLESRQRSISRASSSSATQTLRSSVYLDKGVGTNLETDTDKDAMTDQDLSMLQTNSPPQVYIEPPVRNPSLVNDHDSSEEENDRTTEGLASESQQTIIPPPTSTDAPISPAIASNPDVPASERSSEEQDAPEIYLPGLVVPIMFLPIPNIRRPSFHLLFPNQLNWFHVYPALVVQQISLHASLPGSAVPLMPGFTGVNHSTISQNHINDANNQTNYYNCTVVHFGDSTPTVSTASSKFVSNTLIVRQDQGSSVSPTIVGGSYDTGCLIGGSIDLLDRIQQLLCDETGPLDGHLQLQLDSLSQTLRLSNLAASVAESTPLAPRLHCIIRVNTERCHSLLQRIFEMIDQYRLGLLPFKLWFLWRKVYLWAVDDSRSLDTVRKELLIIQQSLDRMLLALKSVVWTGLSNQSISILSNFRTLLLDYHRNPTLRHIQLPKIIVVDHLGRSLPIPMDFCSSLQHINYLLLGYCQGRIGMRYIQDGDYQLIEPAENQVIGASDVIHALKPEAILEMSIILRQWMSNTSIDDSKKQCPRCHHLNIVTSDGDWIECIKCSGQFAISESKEDLEESQGKKRLPDDVLDKEVATKRRRVEQQIERIEGPYAHDDPLEGNSAHSNRSEKSMSTAVTVWNQEQVSATDETQFFRRIHVHLIASDLLAVPRGPSIMSDQSFPFSTSGPSPSSNLQPSIESSQTNTIQTSNQACDTEGTTPLASLPDGLNWTSRSSSSSMSDLTFWSRFGSPSSMSSYSPMPPPPPPSPHSNQFNYHTIANEQNEDMYMFPQHLYQSGPESSDHISDSTFCSTFSIPSSHSPMATLAGPTDSSPLDDNPHDQDDKEVVPRHYGACTRCKWLKVKCDFRSDTNSCKRCLNGGHECVVAVRKKRRAPPKREHLLNTIRNQAEQIKELMALVGTLSANNTNAPSRPLPQTKHTNLHSAVLSPISTPVSSISQ